MTSKIANLDKTPYAERKTATSDFTTFNLKY